MDIHPLIIHYPIAFLTTYAVFELLRFRKLLDLPYWSYVKGVLVILGEISALVTLLVAMVSANLAGESRLVLIYKLFMMMVAVIFGIISLAYIRRWMNPMVIVPLAVLGLFFIVVAGGLFGATVYGTHFDLYLRPIFELLNVY